MDLEAFQILYLTDGTPSDFVDYLEMDLLRVTRQHMSQLLSQDDMSFQITLFETIRSDEDFLFGNATQLAFTGTAQYSSESSSKYNSSTEKMVSDEYLCFLGANATLYVNSLRNSGWDSLVRVQLLTWQSDHVDYVGGNMTVMRGSNDTASGNAMMENMVMTMYLAAILIPVGLVTVLGCLAWAYCMKYHINWKRPSRAHHPVWLTSHETAEARKKALELELYRDIESIGSRTGSDSDHDRVSERPALAVGSD